MPLQSPGWPTPHVVDFTSNSFIISVTWKWLIIIRHFSISLHNHRIQIQEEPQDASKLRLWSWKAGPLKERSPYGMITNTYPYLLSQSSTTYANNINLINYWFNRINWQFSAFLNIQIYRSISAERKKIWAVSNEKENTKNPDSIHEDSKEAVVF